MNCWVENHELGYCRSVSPGARSKLSRITWLTIALSTVLTLVPIAAANAEEVVNRPFDDETWDDGLVDLRTLDLTRTELVAHGFAGGGLDIRIPTGGFRGFGPLDRLDPAPNEVWYRYHVRLTSWNAASTGKLPGLAGLYSSSARGCIPSTASSPGWSARGLFGVPGTNGAPPGQVPIGTYLYHVDQAGTCGDLLWWPGASLEQGRWHCVEGYVRMNTPGVRNGAFVGYLDGDRVYSKNDIQYRRATETGVGIRHMWHNFYFGGSWPTPNPLASMYDEVVVSTSGRVGCMTPFTDLGGTLHSTALTELHALGLLNGCGYREACPARLLTRGEAAALFSRIFNLPVSPVDYFPDDTGHLFEGAVNRLAHAGITVGCTPTSFCADDRLTRAQFATMLVRAVGLNANVPDAFGDDDGYWAENAINQLAATGLTQGCGPDRFCPRRILPRDEAASFFLRALHYAGSHGLATLEPPPEFPPPGDPPPIPEEEQD